MMGSTATMSAMPFFLLACLLAFPAVVEAGFLSPKIAAPVPQAGPASESSFAQLRQQLADLEAPVAPKQDFIEQLAQVEESETKSAPKDVNLNDFMRKYDLGIPDVQCVIDCRYGEESYGWKQRLRRCIKQSPNLFNTFMKMLPDEEHGPHDQHEVPYELRAIVVLASEVTPKLHQRRKEREAEL